MTGFPALGFDPAPGNLASAQSLAERVAQGAVQVREAADVLGGTGQQDWQGKTAEAFHSTVDGELTPRVVTAADSFTTAANALDAWAVSLAAFQARAEALEARARAAMEDVDRAATAFSAAQGSDDPDVDVEGAGMRLQLATSALDEVRAEAHSLAGSYAAEAEDVAARLQDAGDAAPQAAMFSGLLDGLGELWDDFQEYVLPVLEDIVDILAVAVGIAVVLLLAAAVVVAIMNPVGLAAVMGMISTAGTIGLWLGVGAVGIDALQVAGGREGPQEMLLGLAGLLAGGALGKLASGFLGMASNAGGLSGLVPAVAGVSRGTGGGGAVATAALRHNPVGPLATWGYLLTKAEDQSQGVRSTIEGVNTVGTPVTRMRERFENVFSGEGFVTDKQAADD
jgi:hypothetical protein